MDRPLAKLLNRIIVDPTATLIIPVPLHRKRLQQRSYNQALLLARELARLKKIPLAKDLLQKTVETPAQQELTARERERNLKQAFQVKEALDGERILLVDDVLTTGATAVACSRT
ncbi:MAG: ComF family protein, partial [Desulfuromonadaceae bacterium]|nr:ComF family protein [Desulfuromonadaceae bacterium]